ncbi:MAG: hypothetical protein LAQ69_44110 [Acidobacteriia bacterium]|nr:hypothetical protein [Terriglobia bacterium]
MERLAARHLATMQPREAYFAAQGGLFAFIAMLLGAIAAVVQILEYFGVRPRFSSSVRYDGACSARDFQMAEAAARREGYSDFHGVSTSPRVERNFSMFVAKEDTQNRAEMVTAYDGLQAVNLKGWEPSIFHAAIRLVAQKYQLSETALAQSMAITSRVNRVTNDKVQVSSFRIPGNGFLLHDRTPMPDCPLGKLCIYVPGVTPANISELPVLWLKS